ncbi:unnamed protein product [marine sediment metagenome]|uniref:Uncharacterized protein n=1 Tax=marine sediment metagenome TaxID=412755 RepID=X1C1E9_9ZZZZ
MAKFEISYSRKVQTLQYENITVTLTKEFDDKDIKYDAAFSQVREKVNEWIENELIMLGLK